MKSVFKAGAAQVDITPPPGVDLTGFVARMGPSTEIHDRLFARALALEAGEQQALLITCDLIAVDAPLVAAVRAAIQERTRIPEQNIMIACTHTHSGPATMFLHECGRIDPAYLAQLPPLLIEAAQKAVLNLREARVGFGCGQNKQGVHNRRQPGSPIDPDLNVVGFQDISGQLMAVIVNYACHPVCMDHSNRLISADYPGVVARTLQEQTGAIALFTTGAAGDINPEPMGSFTYAAELGQALAAEAVRILKTLEYQDSLVLRVAGAAIDLPLNPILSQEELQQKISVHQRGMAEEEAAGNPLGSKIHKAMLGWAEMTLAGVQRGDQPDSVPAEIQVIRLGNADFVAIPGEIFSGVGKDIKRCAPDRQVIVLGYTNNDIGYIPTRQAYALGGYEVEEAYKYYNYPAVLAPEAGDMLRQTAARLLEETSAN